MASPDLPPARAGFDFYGPQYSRFATALAARMRREVYGEDIGQQGLHLGLTAGHDLA